MKQVKGHIMKDNSTGKIWFEESPEGKWNMLYWKDDETSLEKRLEAIENWIKNFIPNDRP